MADIKRYYYCEDGETAVGPFAREKFQELLAKEVVTWEVWVTREDESEWRTAGEFDEFKDFEALVASGRAGQNYQSVLEAGFYSSEEDEKRAQDLQSLQRAASRIDLSRFREAAAEREEVPTGEKPSAFWFLRFLRMKPVLILIGFVACLGLVLLVTHGMGKKPAKTEKIARGQTAPAVGGQMGGGANPASEHEASIDEAILSDGGEPLVKPVIKVPTDGTAPAVQDKLADSRVSIHESRSLPADFYVLARQYTVNVDSEAVAMKEGLRVRVIDRQPDMWTVEADQVRFQVSPTDLRRENREGVSTVGTPASRPVEAAAPATSMATETESSGTRPAGRGVPPPAIPAFDN